MHLRNACGRVAPVVRAVARYGDVEGCIGTGQGLRRAGLGHQIGETSPAGFFRNHRQHPLRQIVSHHLFHQRRQPERGMASAASHVQRNRAGTISHQGAHLLQIFAIGVNRAGEIGMRLGVVLIFDDVVMAFGIDHDGFLMIAR